jgi:hypothetical protein
MLWDYLKEAVVNKYMLFGLLGCLGTMQMDSAVSKELWAPMDDLELKALPFYCTPRIKENDKAGWQAGLARFGVGWNHLHHYCYALNYINRYSKTFKQDDRKFYVQEVIGNIDYVLQHAPQDFWFRPEMLTVRGKMLVSAKRGSEAMSNFMKAISENKNHAPAYVALSYLYQDMGQKPKALSIVEEGLGYVPDSRSLTSRYKELTGRTFVPPPTAAIPPAIKVTGPEENTSTNIKPNTLIQPTVSIPTVESIPAPAIEKSPATPAVTQPAPIVEDKPKIGSPSNRYCRFCPPEE